MICSCIVLRHRRCTAGLRAALSQRILVLPVSFCCIQKQATALKNRKDVFIHETKYLSHVCHCISAGHGILRAGGDALPAGAGGQCIPDHPDRKHFSHSVYPVGGGVGNRRGQDRVSENHDLLLHPLFFIQARILAGVGLCRIFNGARYAQCGDCRHVRCGYQHPLSFLQRGKQPESVRDLPQPADGGTAYGGSGIFPACPGKLSALRAAYGAQLRDRGGAVAGPYRGGPGRGAAKRCKRASGSVVRDIWQPAASDVFDRIGAFE